MSQVFPIPEQNIQPNTQFDSQGGQPTNQLQSARIQLTDSNGDWPSIIDNTRHIQIWGLMTSTDSTNGLDGTWSWGPVSQGSLTDSSLWIPFGVRDRHGNLGAISWSASNFPIPPGAWVRLSMLTDSFVTLGATITTN